MMAYAFRALDLREYEKLASEEFEDANDLLAAILAIGMSTQIKRGLERGYRDVEDDIPGVKGKINVLATARHRATGQAAARCRYDEFDEDTYKNQILKRTAEVLVSCPTVKPERKRDLKRCLMSLRDVTHIEANRIEWGRLRYDRNNGGYLMLMNVCYLVLNDNIVSDESGDRGLASFLSGQELHALYERFVLEYFRRHHSSAMAANAKVISQDANRPAFLPSLNTDVTLEGPGGTLVIDCKFYKRILGSHFDHETLSAANINQLHMYVTSEAWSTGAHVEGMLLYAKTCEEAVSPEDWETTGFKYHFRMLDLSQDFSGIAKQLDDVAQMVMDY